MLAIQNSFNNTCDLHAIDFGPTTCLSVFNVYFLRFIFCLVKTIEIFNIKCCKYNLSQL
jgi:hypothetical protein